MAKLIMTPKISSLYFEARRHGYDAKHALYAAKAVAQFQDLEARGLVRLTAEPEQESYFDVFGEPDGYERNGHPVSAEQERKEQCEIIKRLGCWVSVAEYSDDGGETWHMSDSIGMNTGYQNPLDWRENW